MILYYALGGGLGHISRALKLVQQWRMEDYKIITSSNTARQFVDNKHLVVIAKEEINKAVLLNNLLADKNISALYIDTFPCGIRGELNKVFIPPHIEVNYIGRRLKWREYKQYLLADCHFKTSYLLEDLEPAHLAFIQKSSENTKQQSISCTSKIERTDKNNGAEIKLPHDKQIWLIVHSDNTSELEALISYAKDIAIIENCHPYLLVNTNITDVNFDVDQVIFHYPADGLFALCTRVFSACGFNIMQETLGHKIKHFFIPFERRFDDQFWRAQKRRSLLLPDTQL